LPIRFRALRKTVLALRSRLRHTTCLSPEVFVLTITASQRRTGFHLEHPRAALILVREVATLE
jgi:hypothetical protein